MAASEQNMLFLLQRLIRLFDCRFQFRTDIIVKGNVQSAAQDIHHFFCEFLFVRCAMFLMFDAAPFEMVDLLGQFATFFQQACQALKGIIPIRETAVQKLR